VKLLDLAKQQKPDFLAEFAQAENLLAKKNALANAVWEADKQGGRFNPDQLSVGSKQVADELADGGARPFEDLITHGQNVVRDRSAQGGVVGSAVVAGLPPITGGLAAFGKFDPTGAALTLAPTLPYLVNPKLLNKALFERPEALRALGRGLRERAPFGGLFGAPIAIQAWQD